MKSALLLFLLFLNTCLLADEAPHRMEDLLQKTQLIVHGKISSHTSSSFTINVLDILYNYRTGIKEGDYLLIQNDFSIVCPIDVPLEYAQQKKEAIFFLSYVKNKWYITMGDVAFFNGNKAELAFYVEGYIYRGNLAQWKSDLAGYYRHFKRNSKQKLIPKLDRESWSEVEGLSALAQLQYRSFYKDHFRSLNEHPRLQRLEVFAPKGEEPFQSMATVPGITEPISYEKMQEIGEIIAANARSKYPELEANNIEGFVYYTLSFRADGSIAALKIERPLHGKIHEALRDYFQEHPNWPPTLNAEGEAIRYRQMLHLRFKAT
ncbi:MAG: hypothetical protein NXI09_07720 [Bacteroidetes bacterium]|nr:hypothetical protein [Bacteroidota bacterium]